MDTLVNISERVNGDSGARGSTNRLALKPGERWFVARTLAHHEQRAQFNLDQQGFRSYAPSLRRTVRHARKLRTVSAPLFPSYIFVILDLSHDRWRSVNGTLGVASLIMSGDQPRPLPPGIVEALVVNRGSGGADEFVYDFRVGDKVRILSGAFAQTLGHIEHLDDRGRVRVLLEIMGGSIPAVLNQSALAPAV